MGVTVLIGRYLGEKHPEQIGAVLGGAAFVFSILAAVLFVVMVVFAQPIAVLMQAPEAALGQTVNYVRICGCGIFFIVAYNLLSAAFRGLGDSRSPLIFVLVACIVNIVGDLVLVAGFGLDAAGYRAGPGHQCRLCAGHAAAEGPVFHGAPSRRAAESPVPQVFVHRVAAGFAGIFDPVLLFGTLCLRQSTGTGGIVRVRCCVQNRQFFHAHPQCAHAVDGVLRGTERRRGQPEAGQAVDVHRPWHRAGHRLRGVCAGVLEG